MKKGVFIIVLIWFFGQYIIYDHWGVVNSSLWSLYYYFWPSFLASSIILLQIKRNTPILLKIYYGGLPLIIFFHYFRICFKYEGDYFRFMKNISGEGVAYWITAIYVALLLIIILYHFKIKNYASKT